MPRIMTMNGDHRSVATAPLDLRTTSRDRGTPNCKSRVRDAPQGSETGASRKRPTDKASFKLPFRKRPISIEPETPTQTPVAPSSEDRISPAADFTVRQSVAGQVAEEAEDILPASATPRRNIEAGRSPEEYHTCCFYAFEHVRYPTFYPPPVPDLCHPLPHQTENLQHGIALATHQDEDGDTALHIAVVQGELAIVYKLIHLLLLAHRSLDIYNNLRQTPLHLAVITDQATLVEGLLRRGADPAALDRNGQTAMHLCCEYNKKECLSVVLSTSSFTTCLEMRNYEGLSPLHLAVLRGHKDLATMLLKAGADINAMDIKSGQSPLMHAVESNNADMVHFLVEHGCDVNSQSYSGNTALHSACGRGQADTVRLLLKSGADSSLKNYHNDTPVMVAKNKKIEDVLRGRVSTQLRVQDQLVSVSNHEGNFTNIGSPSPSHSRGCSPLMAPHTLHHSTSHSPKTSSTTIFPYFQRNDVL